MEYVVAYNMITKENIKMNDLNCKKCDKPTGNHDDDIVSVTCSLCSMVDVIGKLGELSDEEIDALTNGTVGVA